MDSVFQLGEGMSEYEEIKWQTVWPRRRQWMTQEN